MTWPSWLSNSPARLSMAAVTPRLCKLRFTVGASRSETIIGLPNERGRIGCLPRCQSARPRRPLRRRVHCSLLGTSRTSGATLERATRAEEDYEGPRRSSATRRPSSSSMTMPQPATRSAALESRDVRVETYACGEGFWPLRPRPPRVSDPRPAPAGTAASRCRTSCRGHRQPAGDHPERLRRRADRRARVFIRAPSLPPEAVRDSNVSCIDAPWRSIMSSGERGPTRAAAARIERLTRRELRGHGHGVAGKANKSWLRFWHQSEDGRIAPRPGVRRWVWNRWPTSPTRLRRGARRGMAGA